MTTSITSNATNSVLQVNGVDAVKFNAGGTTSKIQSLAATVGSNALTVTLNPCVLDFRASALTDGTPTTIAIDTALSIVVPSGATLATVSGQKSRIIVLAINNAGTIELAVTNIAGGQNLDETGVITTLSITGGATNGFIYSANVRIGVPYRVVGYIESTQATAGAWATAPSTIQGMGGNALTAMSSLGYGQTWQDMLASRVAATTYYNTTGRTICASISCGVYGWATALVNGHVINSGAYEGSAGYGTITLTIPPNASYRLNTSNGALSHWSELR